MPPLATRSAAIAVKIDAIEFLGPTPFANEHTLMPALGMKARDSAFLEEQKRHLGDLVRAMTHPERERRTRPQRS